MIIKQVKHSAWPQLKPKLLRFVTRFGENRITADSLSKMNRLQATSLHSSDEAEIYVATVGNKLAGISFLAERGKAASILVVSPDYRGQRVGAKLLRAHMTAGTVSCHVAADNLACVNVCLDASMRPVEFLHGPTGKLTYVFTNEQENKITNEAVI